MKRLVSIITILFCIYSVFAITWGKKDELYIFGDKTGNSIIYTVDEQEGWFSDVNHDHEPITWKAYIDDSGFLFFDIYENGKVSDLSIPSPYTISFKRENSSYPIEDSAYLSKSDEYYSNRIACTYPFVGDFNLSKPYKVVVYNEDGIYNLGTVDFSQVENLYYDTQTYYKIVELVDQERYQEAKDFLQNLDKLTYVYYNCDSLLYSININSCLSSAIDRAKNKEFIEALSMVQEYQSYVSKDEDKSKSIIDDILKSLCTALKEDDNFANGIDTSSFYSMCKDSPYYKEALYLITKAQIKNGTPYYTKEYILDGESITATISKNSVMFLLSDVEDKQRILFSMLPSNLEETLRNKGYSNTDIIYLSNGFEINQSSLDVDGFEILWEQAVSLLSMCSDIDYPIEVSGNLYDENAIRTRVLETINGQIVGYHYEDELVFSINSSLYKLLEKNSSGILDINEPKIEEVGDNTIIHITETSIFDEIFSWLEEQSIRQKDLVFIFREGNVLARINYYSNYAQLYLNIDEQNIAKIVAANKSQLQGISMLQKGNSVFFFYPSFLTDENIFDLWEHTVNILTDYALNEGKESLNIESTISNMQPINEEQSSLISTTLEETSKKEESKNPNIQNTTQTQNSSSLSMKGDDDFVISLSADYLTTFIPLNERKDTEIGSAEFKTYKRLLSPNIGFKIAIDKHYFWGISLGLPFISTNLTQDIDSFMLFIKPSLQFEFGECIKDTSLIARVFLKISPKISYENICTIIGGFSIGFPYAEIGVAIDTFANPYVFLSMRYTTSI